MSRSKIFETSTPGVPKGHKSLRSHAREAAEYLTGLPYLPAAALKEPQHKSLPKPGRGASGESSN